MTTEQGISEECPAAYDKKHSWWKVWDWEGDPGVVNGINHFSFFRCVYCREEVDYLLANETEEKQEDE